MGDFPGNPVGCGKIKEVPLPDLVKNFYKRAIAVLRIGILGRCKHGKTKVKWET